jgi:hypothetical protein
MITNKKHLLFADEYKLTNGLTEDAIRCYQIAYPKSKVESARVESYKLLQNPTIEKYINEYKENIRIERENNNLNQLKNQDNTNILQREKVLDMTSTILKLIYNKIVRGKEPSGADVQAYNSTAERLSKMQGFDKPIQNEVALTDIVIKGQKFAKKKK